MPRPDKAASHPVAAAPDITESAEHDSESEGKAARRNEKAKPEVLPASKMLRNQYRISGIMQGESGRLAIINSKIVSAGDSLGDSARIVEIGDRHVILAIEAKRYKITL